MAQQSVVFEDDLALKKNVTKLIFLGLFIAIEIGEIDS